MRRSPISSEELNCEPDLILHSDFYRLRRWGGVSGDFAVSINHYIDPLTERETEVLTLIVEGLSNQEIAERLFLTHGTVKWYASQIYSKLGVNHRIKAINFAKELGLVNGTTQTSAHDVSRPKVLSNLPAYLNQYIGRQNEFHQAIELIKTSRLLSIVGTAGVGKTRFSVILANHLVPDFVDGVCFVPLASLDDASIVDETVAHALGLPETTSQSRVDVISNFLQDKQLLLVLDNFEHVIAAADVVAQWLKECPMLTVIVTSREILRLYGEQVFSLEPLPGPERDSLPDIVGNDAVQLFITRARSMRSNWQPTNEELLLIARICRLLEGLPLSIELAAARSRFLPPSTIFSQLKNKLDFLVATARDVPLRHQSVRSALSWSYGLLQDEEQILFRRLGVFHGGFTLESVGDICLDDLTLDAVDGLASLVEKSLIYVEDNLSGEPRFYVLEVIIEFMSELLVNSKELDILRQKHAYYYSWMFTERDSLWESRLDHFKLEIDNLRASLRFMMNKQDTAAGLHLLSCTFWYMEPRGFLTEGIEWFTAFFQLPLANLEQRTHIRSLLGFGELLRRSGKNEQSLSINWQAVHLARESEDPQLLGWALASAAAHFDMQMPDDRNALAVAHEALKFSEQAHDAQTISWIHMIIGAIYRLQEDYDKAKVHYQTALEMGLELENPLRVAAALSNLGFLALYASDYLQASTLFLEALQGNATTRNRWLYVSIFTGTGNLLTKNNRHYDTGVLYGAIENILQTNGLAVGPSASRDFYYIMEETRTILSPDEFSQAYTEGQSLSLEAAVQFATECLKSLPDLFLNE